MPFNQQMAFPVELTLNTTDDGPRLHFWPVREIENLVQKQQTLGNIELGQNPFVLPTGGHDAPSEWPFLRDCLLDIQAAIDVGDADEIELNLRGIRLFYHAAEQKLFCRDRSAPLEPIEGKIHLRVLLDRASIEIFAADGLVYLPISVIPDDDNHTCFLQAKGGACHVDTITICTLDSSWE